MNGGTLWLILLEVRGDELLESLLLQNQLTLTKAFLFPVWGVCVPPPFLAPLPQASRREKSIPPCLSPA